MTHLVSLFADAYGRLLRLAPAELRKELGEEMTLVFADDLEDSWERGGPAAAAGVCFRAAVELTTLALTHALSVHAVLTALLACAFSMICISAELAVARAHGPTPVSTAPAYVSVMLVLIPSGAAAFIAFLATRAAHRNTPQGFLK